MFQTGLECYITFDLNFKFISISAVGIHHINHIAVMQIWQQKIEIILNGKLNSLTTTHTTA